MTIKQLGGIFGRNPTFNDVDVEGDQSITGDLDVSGDVSIGQSGSVTNLNLLRASANYVNASSSGGYFIFRTGGTTKKRLEIQDDGDVYFFDTAGTTAQMIYTASNSNLSFPSGSGIDFSATSGTGTSELFDDYEEGTWTPDLLNGTGITYNSRSGNYTKIGNFVHVTASIDVSNSDTTDASAITIGGLPFNASNDTMTFTLGRYRSFLAPKDSVVIGAAANASFIQLFESNNNFILYSEINSSGVLYFSGSYRT
jgi:hypothetical protein